jgi:phosphoglycolate phosphatase
VSECRYRLVHLDLDGTLLDTRADLVASTNHARTSFGLDPLPAGTVEHLVGNGARVLVERALGTERRDLHDEAMRRFLEHYGEHCLDHTRAYAGMVELVDGLRPVGVLFSVLTNKPEALARRILTGLGLLDRFIGLVGADTFPERKPDPRGAEHLRALAGADRFECLMVGDSEVDVATARAAGIAVCGVRWGFDASRVVEAGPDVLVDDAAALERVIRDGF